MCEWVADRALAGRRGCLRVERNKTIGEERRGLAIAKAGEARKRQERKVLGGLERKVGRARERGAERESCRLWKDDSVGR